MHGETIHPLRQWREARGFNLGEAAECVGTIRQTWLDWEQSRRIPGQKYMTRIYRATGGTVCANDFYWPHGKPSLSGSDPDDRGGGEGNNVGGSLQAAA